MKKNRIEDTGNNFLQDDFNDDLSLKNINMIKLNYSFIKLMLKGVSLIKSNHIDYLNEKNIVTPKGRSIIYVNTYGSNLNLCNMIVTTSRPLAFFDGDVNCNLWYLKNIPNIGGCSYVEENSDYIQKMMTKYLKSGFDCVIFPKKIIDASQNKLVVDTFYDTVKTALQNDSVVVCTAIEKCNKGDSYCYVVNRKGYLDFSKVVEKYTDCSYISLSQRRNGTLLQEKINQKCNMKLQNELASLLWEICDSYGQEGSMVSQYYNSFVEEINNSYGKVKKKQ